ASDRVSVYDVLLPTPVPDKGRVLTRLSSWWFARLADLVPNHVISTTDVPAEFAGRAVRCRRLQMGPVEASRLPEPIFTPTTKAPIGEHDEAITFEGVVDRVGPALAASLRDLTL